MLRPSHRKNTEKKYRKSQTRRPGSLPANCIRVDMQPTKIYAKTTLDTDISRIWCAERAVLGVCLAVPAIRANGQLAMKIGLLNKKCLSGEGHD